MSARTATLIASAAWSIAVVAAVASVAIRLVRNDPIPVNTFGMGPTAMFAFLVFGMAWATVGALLVTRRPDNATGRYVLLIGCSYVGNILFASITFAGLADGSTTGRSIAGIAGWLTGLATLIGGVAFNVSIFFPTGRGRTQAWDALGRLMFVPVGVMAAYLLTQPGDLHLFPGLANPFGFGVDLRPLIGDRMLAITALGSAVYVPVIGLVVVSIAGALLPGRAGEWPLIAFALTGTTVPVAIGIAILRHHLYDIDRIISRTIAYALVSTIVATVFGGFIALLSAALATVAQGQTLAVAASTLVAFAAFQPVRRRIQSAVDRRFNRTRYDAERTVAAFSARLRDEVDIATVTTDLHATVQGVVKPVSLGLWIRAARP